VESFSGIQAGAGSPRLSGGGRDPAGNLLRGQGNSVITGELLLEKKDGRIANITFKLASIPK